MRMAEGGRRGGSIRGEVAALKRARILDAGTELFYERGYANTTLDDVARRLGVTKPFIYSHVGSKSVLLGEISTRGVARALREIEAATERDGSAAEALAAFVPRYVTVVLESQKSIAINIREEKNLDPADGERLAALRQRFLSKVEALLGRGVADGEIDVPDTRVAAFALVGAVSWTTFWFNPAGALSIEEIADRMTRTILNLTRVGAPGAGRPGRRGRRPGPGRHTDGA